MKPTDKPKEPEIDRRNLTPEQVAQLDQWNMSKSQLQALEDMANILQDVHGVVIDGHKAGAESTKNFASLVMDIRESLQELNDRKDPEMPDLFSKPLKDLGDKFEKALKEAIGGIDVNPAVSVTAPKVEVSAPKVDLTKLEKLLKTEVPKAFQKAIDSIPPAQLPDNSQDLKTIQTLLEEVRDRPIPIPAMPSNMGIMANGAQVSNANPLPTSATFSGTITSSPTFKDDPTNTGETPKYGKTNSSTHKQQVESDATVNNFPSTYPLPSSQVTTLTPPAAITNYALETGGNLATITANTSKNDPSATTGTITIQDTSSTSTTSGSYQNIAIISGTPTANSFVQKTVTGISSVRVMVTGTWTGTLALEKSADGGTNWTTSVWKVQGAVYTTGSTTGNGMFDSVLGGATTVRVRATTAITGTASIVIQPGYGIEAINVLNPIRIYDNTSGATMTVKAASTLPLVTDPAAVVTLRDTAAISAASLPLPSGAATESTLSSIKSKTDNIPTSPSQEHTAAVSPNATRLSDGTTFYKATTPSDTQPISVASLPLPSGAATAANQLIGLLPKVFDAITYTATSGTIDTYQLYTGGTGGTLVATLTVTFTASDHQTLVSAVRT